MVVGDLLVGSVFVILLGEVVSVILIELVEKGPHDVLRGCLVDLRPLLFTVGG